MYSVPTHVVFLLVCCLILAKPSVAGAHLVHGIVNGPGGPVADARVVLQPSGQPEADVFTGPDGTFAIDIPQPSLDWIRPEPPVGSNGLIGEQVNWVNIEGGREVRLTLANEVTISGFVDVPAGFSGGLDHHLERLDKFDRGGDWSLNFVTYEFTATQPAGVYAIWLWEGGCSPACDYANRFSWLIVDASDGDVTGLTIPFPSKHQPILDHPPPQRSLLTVGPADASGIAAISGSAGATVGPARVQVVNLNTGQVSNGASIDDGSFNLDMMAPPGTWLSVHQDPVGIAGDNLMPGTIVRTQPPGDPSTGFAVTFFPNAFQNNFASNSPSALGVQDRGTVWISGDLISRNWNQNQVLNMSGTLRIYSRNASNANLNDLFVCCSIFLDRIFDSEGNQELSNPEFMSHVLTPTGLPIEKRGKWAAVYDRAYIGSFGHEPFAMVNPNVIEAQWSSEVQVPANLPDGVYRLGFELQLDNLPVDGYHFEGAYPGIFDKLFEVRGTGLIMVGAPSAPRLSWALGLNYASDGRRGLVAEEDEGRLQIAGRVTSNAASFIVPMGYPETGTPISYRLEPFVPLVSASNRGWMTPPTVPFQFPSGSLSVEIEKPDGSTQFLGPAPFAQAQVRDMSGLSGNSVSGVSNTPDLYYSLTTLDPTFHVAFDQYGLHRITMTGSIDDVWGTTYPGGGTYNVWIARHLDIETGVMPHTPFEVGDSYSPAVVVQPGVAADIEIAITHFPNSDEALKVIHVIQGRANRFGYYQPPPDEVFNFATPGEYRFDLTASYTDQNGVLWMGSQVWASVVETPASPLVAHGRRNLNCNAGTHEQWVIATADNICGTHLPFPYHTGDIMWMRDTTVDPFFTAAFPSITVQDIVGDFADLVRIRNMAVGSPYFELEDSIAIGQIPLFSSRTDGNSPFWLPYAPDTHMAYLYAGVSRPGVRIRDIVSEDDTQNSYWRFEDSYSYQAGVGIGGDLPNDFKFQFGGAVYRAPDQDFFYYGAYGSMWVLLPDDDAVGTRVMPPFQGNAGGPSGGPIMTVAGHEIDMFFHPTGVRPGSILEVGDFASFAGQLGPTLPSDVQITIVSPTGQNIEINGQANKVGYFYDPSTDFQVTEPGAWNVFLQLTHNGQTSAGPTQEPYPNGGILGVNTGGFHFYVVERDSEPLQVNGPAESWVEPGLGPIGFTAQVPDGWTDPTLHRMTVMPGFMMEDRALADLDYNYDAPSLGQDFPNLDLFDSDWRTGVDTITISFLLEGLNAQGETVYRARQFLIQGEELMRPLQLSLENIFLSGFE